VFTFECLEKDIARVRETLLGANRAADLMRVDGLAKEWDRVKRRLAVRGKPGYDESLAHYEKFQRLVESLGLSALVRKS